MSNGYNGWTNYETWRINLEMFDGYEISDWMSGNVFVFPDDRDEAVEKLAEHFCDFAHEVISNDVRDDQSFAYNLATSFLSHVIWEEIAEHYVDDYIAELN